MAKDPAVLLYTSDFLTGTILMSNEQVGAYIRLLCLQHQKQRLSEKDMLKICGTHDADVFDKFIKDENGLYYNERLDNEANRRRNYSESRRNNRTKAKLEDEECANICDTHELDMKDTSIHMLQHMETETETISNTINVLSKKEEFSEKQISEFNKFKGWLTKNALQVTKMKEPFTIEEFIRISDDYEIFEIQKVLSDMHNYAPLLKKSVSANKTARNWLNRDNVVKKQNKVPQEYIPQPSKIYL